MSCNMKDILLDCVVEGEKWGETQATIFDYCDGTWKFMFGPYQNRTEIGLSTESAYKFFSALDELLRKNEEGEAVASGDFENESAQDRREVEAWLDN